VDGGTDGGADATGDGISIDSEEDVFVDSSGDVYISKDVITPDGAFRDAYSKDAGPIGTGDVEEQGSEGGSSGCSCSALF
jgi:hypothetical protein